MISREWKPIKSFRVAQFRLMLEMTGHHLKVLPEAVVRRCSVKKGVLRMSPKFAGKHLWQNFFFNKAEFFNKVDLQFYFKRDSGTGVFLKILRNLRTPFFIEHLQGLLFLTCISFGCVSIIQVVYKSIKQLSLGEADASHFKVFMQ